MHGLDTLCPEHPELHLEGHSVAKPLLAGERVGPGCLRVVGILRRAAVADCAHTTSRNDTKKTIRSRPCGTCLDRAERDASRRAAILPR